MFQALHPLGRIQHRYDSPFYEWKGPNETTTERSITTVAFQNLHGLYSKTDAFSDKLSEVIQSMETYKIDILGVSEHNIALSNMYWRQHLYETIRNHKPGQITSQFNSGPEFDASGRLMGGTGLIALGDVTGRLESNGKTGDDMGRWSVMHLRRQRLPPVTVISIYQVCHTPTNCIGNTSWHQQRRCLDLMNRHEHPRKAFIHDLIEMVQNLQAKGHSVIIGGDWNDWLEARRSQLAYLCTTLNLLDPWTHYSPRDTDFATYENGQHRIDSILISHDLHASVSSIRYSPGGLLCATDHRAVIIDFHTPMLFGSTHHSYDQLVRRGVKSNDRKSVTIFIEAMHKHLQAHNAFARGTLLKTGDSQDSDLVEQLDKLVGEAGDIGDRRCLRRRPTWFSTELATTRHAVSILRYYVNGLKFKADRSRSIRQRLQHLKITINLPPDICDAQKLLQEYENNLKDLERKSFEKRSEDMEKNQQGAQHKAKKIIRGIKSCEHNAKTWKSLSFMSNNGARQKLNRLDVPASWPAANELPVDHHSLVDPKSATAWKSVTDPASIERYLTVRNCLHFGQAHGTPFTVPPLCDDIDWGATSTISQDILNGTYQPPEIISDLCKTLLTACRACTTSDRITPEITPSEFEGKIRVWREQTTTSPSGRHLGRYKALYADSVYPKYTIEYDTFSEKQFEIRQLILQIMNFSICTGHPLQRWQKIVNTMIFKEQGAYQIHKLRVIHIFEADLNLLYAVKSRTLVHHADQHGMINSGQYGGRPGYEATSLALMEELRLDISYATRRSLATFDNDAASCYDRMVPNLVSLVNQKYGLHQDLTRLHGQILATTKYQIHTPNGPPSSSYSHSAINPLYGTGQGAGNSPTIWLLLSSLLFDVFEQSASGAVFCGVNANDSTKLGISGFVDDTNLVANSKNLQHDSEINNLLEALQHDAQRWCNLLFISGGKLELAKCTYHALRFQFKSDGTPSPVTSDDLPPLILTDPATNQSHSIPFLPATRAHKILGHWKAPADPKQTQQLQALVIKANRQAVLIATSPITRQGAYLAYGGKYVASLRYVLPQCWFSQAKLHASEKYSMSKIIAKCGYARTTPHALIYAPRSLAGGGFLHWSTIQGEGQIKHFLKHWRTFTHESVLLRINLSWTQWQAGTGESILHDVDTPLPHIESRWLPTLRTFLSSISGRLELDDPYIPELERQGDMHIMDLVIQSGDFTEKEICTVNYCHLYLHIATISEMFNAQGTTMLPHIFTCERPPWFNPNTRTVIQQRPSRYQRKFQWQRLCRMLCTSNFKAGQWINLSSWIRTPDQLRQRREAYVEDDDDRTMYVWHGTGYDQTRPHGMLDGQYEIMQQTDWVPTQTSSPVDIHAYSTPRRCIIQTTESTKTVSHDPANHTSYNVEDYLMKIPKWEQMLLQNITWIKQPHEIMHYIMYQWHKNDKLLIVSDGSSLDQEAMSYGLVMGASNGTKFLEAMGPASGIPSSHRAECTGCLAGGLIIKHIQLYTGYSIPGTVEIQILSDNMAMINHLKDRMTYSKVYPNATLRADWDLLEEIYTTYTKALSNKYEYRWVQGHQDSQHNTSLPTEANFNIEADHLAGEYTIMHSTKHQLSTPMMTMTGCILYIRDIAYHGNYSRVIRSAAARPDYDAYLSSRFQWNARELNQIDWEVFQASARKHDSSSVHLLKLVYDKLPTNTQRAKYNDTTSPLCHFCPCPDTFEHLCLSCCNPRSIAFRSKLAKNLINYFEQHSTPTQFRIAFTAAMHRWFNMNNIPDPSPIGVTSSYGALQHQAAIGWSSMFRGFLSRKWATLYRKSKKYESLEAWCEANAVTQAEQFNGTNTNELVPAKTSPQDQSTDAQAHLARRSPTTTQFLAGIIQIVWTAMGDLWTDHLEYINKNDTKLAMNAQREAISQQIRILHKSQDKTLARHRNQYFFADLDNYLTNASTQQMKNYIARYKPVIMHSIRQANKIATSSHRITNFPGFTQTQNNVDRNITHPALEEPPHRKHTRIRNHTIPKITSFFKPKPTI